MLKKWQVWLADLNPQRGTEPGKIRPVVIVQTDLLNGVHPSTVVCPITTHIQPHARYLRIHLKLNEGGLDRVSDILVDQIRAIDNRRLLKKMGEISQDSRRELNQSLHIVLDA